MERALNCIRALQRGTPLVHCQVRNNIRNILCRFQADNGKEPLQGIDDDARDHLKRTKTMRRHNDICPAQVVSIKDISPAVKNLTLRVDDGFVQAASFKAGQWIDMMIPGVDKIGGFSICSSPVCLQQKGLLELAVKFSDHPPAFWIHTECKIGALVDVRVGGNFYYQENGNKNTLLVAGGVGVNPLLSILRYRRDIHCQDQINSASAETAIIYSAKSIDELIFQEEIRSICSNFPAKCRFHVNKESNSDFPPSDPPSVTYREGRITQTSLSDMISHFIPETTDTYICGPPNFIDAMERDLRNLGFLEENIFYEKWW